MDILDNLDAAGLAEGIARMWDLSGPKLRSTMQTCPPGAAAPVYTESGRYTARGWTDWTRGFQYGSALLQFEATGEEEFLDLGREATLTHMPRLLTHMGVHDHGFNIVSTFGNLWRMLREGRLPPSEGQREYCELALKVSGAVQARRWTALGGDRGFIHSFNGPHSLFIDTIRSLRSLALAHCLGQQLLEEGEKEISLLHRLLAHALVTAEFSIFYGKNRDVYDKRGRTAHESLFNVQNGSYRCPSTQQGYSPFSTWMRGLAWAILGFSELLEFLEALSGTSRDPQQRGVAAVPALLESARATGDFYIANTPTDGIPYWDTGAPGLAAMGDYLNCPSQPENEHEPVDSSAAAIAAQGLLRLGHTLRRRGEEEGGRRFWQAGLTVLAALLSPPYLSEDRGHQGLLLHAVYHRPNGWDRIQPGRRVPNGESCMWGDYHLREAALYIQKNLEEAPYFSFFSPVIGLASPIRRRVS